MTATMMMTILMTTLVMIATMTNISNLKIEREMLRQKNATRKND